MRPSNYVLLTGAGFTHNFGAPLASGMWAQIFSHPAVQASESVKRALLDNFDFESVYDSVTNDSSFDSDDRIALKTAILDSFAQLDATVRHYGWGGTSPILIKHVQQFLHDFAGESDDEIGYLFTLNQDLFVERQHYNWHIFHPISLPGIPQNAWRLSDPDASDLTPDRYAQLPDAAEVDILRKELANNRARLKYIKLHGSQNWLSKQVGERLVIGRGKKNQIAGEPLLSWYFEIFEEVLACQSTRLLCIGYGFADGHINEVLCNAAIVSNLQIHIVNPSPPAKFRSELKKHEGWEAIWTALEGYHQCTLQDLFPRSGDVQDRNRLYRSFFGRDPVDQ